jgi:hypothetical protein
MIDTQFRIEKGELSDLIQERASQPALPSIRRTAVTLSINDFIPAA